MSKKQSGFTLIELMVVVAIIGILAAVAIPAFMKNARKAKTAEAVTNVKKIYDGARSYYEEEMNCRGSTVPIPKQFPSSLDEMSACGLLDPALSDGVENGYYYGWTATEDWQQFKLTAIPLVPGVTGDSIINTDESGRIAVEFDPATIKVDNCLRKEAVTAIGALNRLSGGAALGMAEALVGSESNTAAGLGALAPAGAQANIGQLLGNVPAAAALPQLNKGDDGRAEGDDADLAQILGEYLAGVRKKVEPIINDPVVVDPPRPDAGKTTASLLAEVAQVTAGEAAAHLVKLAGGLTDADLAPVKPKTDQRRREALTDAAQDAVDLINEGKLRQARKRLSSLRELYDGDRRPPDLVTGAAAARLLRQTDLTLGLLGP